MTRSGKASLTASSWRVSDEAALRSPRVAGVWSTIRGRPELKIALRGVLGDELEVVPLIDRGDDDVVIVPVLAGLLTPSEDWSPVFLLRFLGGSLLTMVVVEPMGTN